ncbi:hypothetical protein CYJ25_04610, partial [Schaalia turicensis]
MSIQAMTWAWGLEALDTSQVMVLLALADAANDDGFACWPSQETLARKSRMSVRSVKRHIATLRDAGLIDVRVSEVLCMRFNPQSRRRVRNNDCCVPE